MIMNIKDKIRDFCAEIGFDDCGFAKVGEVENDKRRFFENWLKNGYNAGMQWIERNTDIRFNPKLLMENAEAAIVVLQNHNFKIENNDGKLARCFLAKEDYHVSIKRKLNVLSQKISEIMPEAKFRPCVDTAPILEKYWAQKAGLGVVGKNTVFISNKIGSFCNIGILLIDKQLQTEKHSEPQNLCENCDNCIKSCPTNALIAAYTLDCNKCISYQSFYVNKNDKIKGCDVCQEVCPRNINRSSLDCG